MYRSKVLIFTLLFFFVILSSGIIDAQSTAIDNGITWLINKQNPDGSWDVVYIL
jgi:squalene cyclase